MSCIKCSSQPKPNRLLVCVVCLAVATAVAVAVPVALTAAVAFALAMAVVSRCARCRQLEYRRKIALASGATHSAAPADALELIHSLTEGR